MTLKTHKGVAKRFKLTKTGRLKYARCGKGHLLSKKRSKKKRHLRKLKLLAGKKNNKYLNRLLPYK